MSSEAALFADAEMIEAELPQLSTATTTHTVGTTKDARTSFTADSPYYTSYVEKEMRQVAILSETLKEISSRAKTFGKCGALMAESTRRLSSACRLEKQVPTSGSDDEGDESGRIEKEERAMAERRESVGDEMSSVLQLLAEVLDEIASAQVQMCESLEASLVVSLESFADTEMQQVVNLKADAESVTESAEAAFGRYLNGRHADKLSGSSVESWAKVSEQASSQIGSTLQKWRSGDLLSPQNTTPDRLATSLKNWRQKEEGGGGVAPPPNPVSSTRRGRSGGAIDPFLQQASTAANLQLTLEQIRLAQASAELKRFQLVKKLVSIKKRRNFELGESALASLHGIRAYFNNCSDLVQGLAPRLNRIQNSQSSSRVKHEAQQAPWESREQGLINAMSQVGLAVEHASETVEAINQSDADVISKQPTTLEVIEDRTHIWHLPAMLAESSRYQRDPAPGVLVEGWLYKKSSSRMSLQQWSRRWFMMDKDGIYYFHLSADNKKSNGANGYLHTLERVKICDTVLCMVRELNNDGLRFRFEIVTPNQRPLQLQARGPEEYKMWVEGIRLGAQNQLVHGDVSPDALMQGLGKKKKKRGDAAEVTLASMVETEPTRSSSSEENAASNTVPPPQFHDSDDDDEEQDKYSKATSAVNEVMSSTAIKRPLNPMVQKILDANPVCADCGKASPDWACINLGVLVCIECSGVHRSLGVHLSKVRSLRMDSLSDSECRLLLSLGNDRVNPIWESGLESQRGWEKPGGDDSRKVKEDWIKSKYQWKGFLEVDSTSDHRERSEKASRDLYNAASRGNLMGVAEALAHGGSVDWKNRREGGKTALHAVAISKAPSDDFTVSEEWQGIECAELLLQNGAKMKVMDDNHQGPLDCAVIGGSEREMIEFLSARAS